ncbi:MAG: phosphoethanolamine--lipid A transferase [Proteobacteria bacterium]|nr:phosphoethanolamine--lipid A transferase [Pseudomonadota bacterium]MBU1641206.1 phosphoethanolamine--lipid A transferase [Pseudomonadota bacterium]
MKQRDYEHGEGGQALPGTAWPPRAPDRQLSAGVGTSVVSVSLALFFTLCDNSSFWGVLAGIFHGPAPGNIAFFFSVFVVLAAVLTILMSLLSFRYVLKPVMILLFLTAALAGYFMDSYGVMIDRKMIQNVVETDPGEVFELLSGNLFYHFVLMGVLPSVLLWRTEICFEPFFKELYKKTALIVVCGLLAMVSIAPFYKEYMSLGRNNGYVRYLINPTSYIYAFMSTFRRSLALAPSALQPLGLDAHLAMAGPAVPDSKKNLVILVVGEAARASQFSLNGYSRQTNPKLTGEEIINYDNFYSCGTSTAVSVPCMFSLLGRDSYSDSKAKQQENLLDVIHHAGIEVLWRDNNSGCKGVCKGVTTETMSHLQVADFCGEAECYDEILLHDLENYVQSLEADGLIVLHQKGSHGPAYYLRHPVEFTTFSPECTTTELQECSQAEIVNAYDNTILYTDYFLDQVIAFLKKNEDRFNTAMLYVSDHGQSLGENNLYLHGLPYMIAPDEQKHVPFILWLSNGFAAASAVDTRCLQQQRSESYSHDNLFHSVLGLMGVETAVYNPELDIFAQCR